MAASNILPPALSNGTLVSIEAISKTIANKAGEVNILESITFTIPANSLFAITGPSGSGKSTLLNILTGIDRPTTGRILFAGQEIRKMNEDQLARWRGKNIGIVFQFFQLIPTLTVMENILLALELGNTRRFPRKQWRKRAMECLAQVELEQYANRLPGQLSGGQQQRVAIARAIVNDPPIVVADEPTGNLDTKNAQAVFTILKELTALGKTVVYVTHDIQLAQLSTHRIHLLDGHLATDEEYNQQALFEKQAMQ